MGAVTSAAKGSFKVTTKRIRGLRFLFSLALLAPALLITLFSPATALAVGKSSSGDLLFYPCTRCHPLGQHPAATRPNRFKGHQIKLIAHDKLGKGAAACLVCHDSPERNPGMLKLIDGSLVPITGDISQVCYRCHSIKYLEWKAGIHGKGPRCTTAGCHDPHTPQWIGVTPILPFLGTTIEVKAVGVRRPFRALPGPPAKPESLDFLSMKIVALLALIVIVAAFALPALERRRLHGRF